MEHDAAYPLSWAWWPRNENRYFRYQQHRAQENTQGERVLSPRLLLTQQEYERTRALLKIAGKEIEG